MTNVAIERVNARRIGAMRIIISAPFIYAMLVPLVLFDVCLEIYHHVCFPLYGIAVVPRSRYVRIDRQRLKYLSGASKINCMYCGYANGLVHYASVIAAMTELYWCPIQHKAGEDYSAPRYHHRFAKYNDVQALNDMLQTERTDPQMIGE